MITWDRKRLIGNKVSQTYINCLADDFNKIQSWWDKKAWKDGCDELIDAIAITAKIYYLYSAFPKKTIYI